MSDLHYDYEQNAFVPGFAVIAACLFSANDVEGSAESLSLDAYTLSGTSATYNVAVSNERSYMLSEFEQEIGKFYARLLNSQEPLGTDFERVLHENLWDLYGS